MAEYAGGLTPTRALAPATLWNVALFSLIYKSHGRRPCLSRFIDYYTADISPLLDNVAGLIDLLRDQNADLANCSMQKGVHTIVKEDDPEKREKMVGRRDSSVRYGIAGIADMVDNTKREVYELKVSKHTEPQAVWMMQVLGYALFHWRHNGRKLHVVNLAKGRMWSRDVAGVFPKQREQAVAKYFGSVPGLNEEQVARLAHQATQFQVDRA